MAYMTIIIYFETAWSYPRPSNQNRTYWSNRLSQLHQQMMAQGREQAEAIRQCKREYDYSRGGGSSLA